MAHRLGIVGTGRTIGVANDHMKGIKAVPEWQVSAIYDLSREHAEQFAARHELSVDVISSSLDELLASVDAVVICTDNRSHGDIIREALKRKLPILCEKPLARGYQESKQLADEAEAAGVINYMAMQYRYHPYAQCIKEHIAALGDVYYYRSKLGGARISNSNVGLEWRMQKELSGPGALIDFGVHQFDLLHYFLQESCGGITTLQAELATAIKERDQLDGSGKALVTNDDIGAVIARLANGALVTLSNSRVVPDDGNGLEIVGSNGAIWMDGKGDLYLRGKNSKGAWGDAQPLVIEERHKFAGLARGKQYKDFYDAINRNVSINIDFRYGAEIVRLVDAAVLSSEEGRRVHITEIH